MCDSHHINEDVLELTVRAALAGMDNASDVIEESYVEVLGVGNCAELDQVQQDILYGHNRCAWLKARRINRFRAFLSPDFFICTIDAKGPFKPCYRIQTSYRPELTRNSTLSSEGSC